MTGLDLAVIGNCTVASVISPVGRHVWFCFRKFDADPLFDALLGGTAPKTGFVETRLRVSARLGLCAEVSLRYDTNPESAAS
jgi:hypothetical protein